MTALQGLRVLDLTRVLAGPYCTQLLADYGADVIKVEQPGQGDSARSWGPPWVGELSAYFLCANRNKRSIALDIKSDQGRALRIELANASDVLIENFKVGTVDRLGIDYATLSQTNPRLVYCSISGYGQSGPSSHLPGYDFMIQAQGGIMSITGEADGEPSKVGVAIVDITTGLFASNAIQAALLERERSGKGQYIDLALLDAQIAWLANVAQNYFATGMPPQRYGNGHANLVPYQCFPTSDGQIAIAIGSDEQYRRFCMAGELPELWQDERFQTNPGRVTYRDELVPRLSAGIRLQTTARWIEICQGVGVPAAPINDVPTALDHPQVQHREMVQQVVHPTVGPMDLLGPVAKLSRTPATIRSAPPLLGEHTADVLAKELGLSEERIAGLRKLGVIQ